MPMRERPSRRTKFESRIYNFLTRSRSRSRSKLDIVDDTTKARERMRRESIDTRTKPATPSKAANGTKPASRIPSRPLSSTTTATNSTVTPSTPKAKRRPPSALPVPPPPSQPEPTSPPTPKPSSVSKKNLQNLWGIPQALRRSSRSRSRSRPNSPQPSPDGNRPPLPKDDPTPKPRRSSVRPPSPPRPKPRPSDSPAASNSLKLPKLFSGRTTTAAAISGANSLQPRAAAVKPLKPPASVGVSAPLKRPTSSHQSHQHHAAKNASMDAGYRYRGGTMSVVTEESLRTSTTSLKGKAREATETPQSHLRAPGGAKMSSVTRSTKHGSFDFERPGWGAALMQRTGSNGTAVTATSERESANGAGLAGVGTLQRDKSLKRAKDTEEEIRARERARRLQEYIQKDKLPPVPVNGYNSDHVNGSTSTNGTAHTAQTNKSSSWGKAAGKKMLGASRAGGSGTGVSRFIGTAQHVPSPTRSTGSNGTVSEVTNGRGDRGSEEKSRKGEKKFTLKGGDRPPVPVPVPSSIPRPGHRGRSLDLGIGLAWAPTKMKEAALLPSTTLFSRTASGSSSLGRSASGSTVGQSASSSTNGNDSSSRSRRIHIQDSDAEAERSKLGKEVAEVFRNILDDRSYSAFKTYVRQFDAHEIPFDGPAGIVERVERLLKHSPDRGQDNRVLLDKFVRIILQNA
ncbi:hypothetical protein DFP72DRAFT_987503 [Ephemerocybe angulata]|uniref:Uncharacterized protein n=1 Tax=Ephemerocybe angulata TaxID=980116 RepID=A0A8H6IE42_9AGAR|nr:hypothetical protein DFP72DRAFT_987503 [Tulosesus angulatus]